MIADITDYSNSEEDFVKVVILVHYHNAIIPALTQVLTNLIILELFLSYLTKV